MRANELRIGNFIRFNNFISKEEIIQVNARFFSSLCNGRAARDIKNDEELNGYYSPIELTPEILERCGFEKHDIQNGIDFIIQIRDGFYFDFRFLKAAKEWKEFLLVGNGGYDEAGELNIEEQCKYLHQLQNLFHSLTGKEIEVNL